MSMLDQNDIDALLAAADSDEGMEEQEPEKLLFSRNRKDLDTVEIRQYDFKRPERVSKDQMLALETLHEAFARNFGASLSGFLRTIVEVRVAACEQMTYGEFVSGLPNPTSYNLIQPDSLEGQMCLEVSPLIIYPIIDRLLGGTNQDLFIPQRPMTAIEQRLISNVMGRGLNALSEAWESVRPLKFEITANESNPQLVQIVPPNEVVMVIGLEVRMASRAGTMNLCIPYNVIEPVMEELSAQSWFAVSRNDQSQSSAERITKNIDQTGVEVSAVLAETTITLKELSEMKPGDLIVTTTGARETSLVMVGKEPKFRAEIGQHRGKRAIRIASAVHPGERRHSRVPDKN
ncbi:MAG: flagellar motor switch protein FliM [Phycisphaerales bacterium]|nr:flagellar motor switch protein FliM [Phycisphaerales bacterium]